MEGLLARGQRLADAARDEAIGRVAAAAEEALPEITLARETDGVTLAGRGLARRLAEEPALRWIGSLVR